MVINISLAILSAAFLMLALQIETPSDDLWGPKLAPIFLAGSMLISCLAVTLVLFLKKRSGRSSAGESKVDNSSVEDLPPFLKIFWVIILGIFYFYAISLIGYFVSTVISLFVILFIFENVNLKKNALISVVGALIYYLAFIQALGIYDPGFKVLELLSSAS